MDLFFECLNHRADYICYYNYDEKKQMSDKLLKMLNQTNEMLPREIELTAVLYKWSPQEFKNVLFDRVFQLASEQPLTTSFIVAICNYIWINNKVFSIVQKQRSVELLNKWTQTVPEILLDTIQHTLYSLNNDFKRVDGRHPKVCLLIPEFLSGLSFLQPPIDFMTVCSELKKSDIDTTILDNRAWHYSEKQVMDLLSDYEVIVVNTTPIDQVQNYFVDYRYALTIEYLKEIKRLFPEKKVIICGSHGTVRSDLVEKHLCADIIIHGEYIDSCIQVVKSIYANNSLTGIPNISIRAGEMYVHTDVSSVLMHPPLNEHAYPDYDSVDLLGYYGNVHYQGVNVKKNNWSILMTSCGCPFQCIFCYKFFGNTIRRYSLFHVMNEVHQMIAHKIDSFFIIDQLFTSDRSFVIEFCNQIIAENLQLKWSCQTRVDHLDAELLHLMKAAGCNGIWLGLESVTDSVLETNKKGTSQKQLIECISLLKETDISFNVFFMIGMPGETKESLNALYEFMVKYKLPCTKSFMVCTPRYGTKMYELAEQEHPLAFDDFHNLNEWKGLIGNYISQEDIQATIHRLSNLLD